MVFSFAVCQTIVGGVRANPQSGLNLLIIPLCFLLRFPLCLQPTVENLPSLLGLLGILAGVSEIGHGRRRAVKRPAGQVREARKAGGVETVAKAVMETTCVLVITITRRRGATRCETWDKLQARMRPNSDRMKSRCAARSMVASRSNPRFCKDMMVALFAKCTENCL